MPLSFSPAAYAYDAARDALDFRGFDGRRPVGCSIDCRLLRMFTGTYPGAPNEAVALFASRAEHFQHLASVKFDRGELDRQGRVVLGHGDFAGSIHPAEL